MKYFLFCIAVLFLQFGCTAQQDNHANAGVLFYNLENLYDTINDPAKDDEVFLPDADRQWNGARYRTKLNHIAKVFASAGNQLPAIIGVCEVENSAVLNDLVKEDQLKAANYKLVHFDSPDERGIDVAMLYDPAYFSPVATHALHVALPGDSVDYTRDILYVNGELSINNKKNPVHVFVNHWPSRTEGEEVSAPKRAAAAAVLKHTVDSINAVEKDAAIIIMGDFNDTPFDKSIHVILGAKYSGEGNVANQELVNLVSEQQKNGEGSYNYKGNWQCLDQLIVSGILTDGKKLDVSPASAGYIKKDFMLYHSEKYGDSPDRTYSGTKYIGGYSDHLPVYMELILK